MNRWFVAHTQVQGEARAACNLERQGFTAFVPRYRKRRRHARRVDTVSAALFPGYVFINFDVERARWRSINGTFGVRHLVCQGNQPAALADGIVEEIKTREDADGLVRLDPAPLTKGQRLRIVDGPFYDTAGLFAKMADRDRVIILLNLLGRQLRVRVPLNDVTVDA